MEQTKKVYYDELNIYRALIIFWVVLGHAFEEGSSVFGFLHAYAYTFHMAAFFALSGFLLAPKLKEAKSMKAKPMLILDRAKRLLVPFYFFSAVSVALKLVFDKFAKNPFADNYSLLDFILGRNNPNGGLWFLQTLFALSIVFILLSNIPDIAVFVLTVIIKLSLIFYMPQSKFLIICMYYAVYLSLGVLVRNSYPVIQGFMKRLTKRKAFSIVSAICMLVIALLLSPYKKAMGNFETLLMLYNIFVWYFIAFITNEYHLLKNSLMIIGDYGMDIYMLGYYVQIAIRVLFAQILGLSELVYSPLMLVFGFLLPIPISKYFVRKFRLTSALMLGSFPKKDK